MTKASDTVKRYSELNPPKVMPTYRVYQNIIRWVLAIAHINVKGMCGYAGVRFHGNFYRSHIL